MFKENKKVNPLDNNSSDPTFINPHNGSVSWTLEFALTSMGWLIVVTGFIGSLILGVSLKTVESYSMIDATYSVPHPMRWIYSIITFISALFSAFIMFGLAEILKRLDSQKSDNVRK